MIVICRDTQNILIATNESTLILFVKQVLSLGLKENKDSYMFFWCNCSCFLWQLVEAMAAKYSQCNAPQNVLCYHTYASCLRSALRIFFTVCFLLLANARYSFTYIKRSFFPKTGKPDKVLQIRIHMESRRLVEIEE